MCSAQAIQRYLKLISSVATPEVVLEKLQCLAETKTENNHRYKGFNLFSEEDTCLFRTLLQGEFAISGFTNKQVRQPDHPLNQTLTRSWNYQKSW